MEAFLNSLTDESQRLFVLSVVTAFVLAIALVIVVFLSRIKFLKNRLFDAKEIDESKNSRISELQKRLEEMQIKDDALEQELKQFNDTKASLQSKKELIFKMQERMDILEEKERHHINTVEAYSREFQTLAYRYKGLKKRNEFLVEENSRFRAENTKTLMKVREQERRIFEKLMSLQGNTDEQLKEIEKMADTIFEKNRVIFDTHDYDAVMAKLIPLSDDMLEYQKEIVSSFKKSLERERDMQGDIMQQIESKQKIREKIDTLLEKLKDESRLEYAGSDVVRTILELSGLDGKRVKSEMKKDADHDEKTVSVQVALPNGQKLMIDTAFPLESYEEYRQEIDPAKKEKAYSDYLALTQKYIESLSRKISGKGICWILIPSAAGKERVCSGEGRLCDQAAKKGILLIDPETLLSVLESVVLLWEYRRHYDLAMQLISKAEEIQDQFIAYGEEIGAVSKRLEMIQGSFPVSSNLSVKSNK